MMLKMMITDCAYIKSISNELLLFHDVDCLLCCIQLLICLKTTSTDPTAYSSTTLTTCRQVSIYCKHSCLMSDTTGHYHTQCSSAALL